MVYQIVAILIFAISAAVAAFAIKLLANKKWIVGFVRGCIGVFFLLAATMLMLAGRDVYSYQSASGDTNTVVTVSFHKQEANNYIVELQEPSGRFYSREIEGQQWQLTARAFTWPPLMSVIGLRSGYRLETLSGRFIELQLDKLAGQKPPETLSASSVFDSWQFLSHYPAALPFVSAHLATMGFIPIADGAIYEVVSAGQSLSVNPVNDAAKNAMKSW